MMKKIYPLVTTLVLAISLITSSAPPQVSAAAGTMYFNPSNVSVENGGQIVVQVRANATNINAAQVDVGYDPSKLGYVGYSVANSALPSVAAYSPTPGLVKISSYVIGSVTGDNQLIASFTFKAIAGSGSTSLTLLNTEGIGDNTSVLVGSGATATVTLTSPVQTPAPGPTPAPSPAPSTTKPPGTSNSNTTPQAPPAQNTPAPTAPDSTQPTVIAPSADSAKPTFKTIAAMGYVNDEISVKLTTNEPTRAVIEYGKSKDGLLSSATSETFATSYIVPLGDMSKAATEAKSLFYSVEIIDAAGNTTVSGVQELSTKPVKVTLVMKDGKGKVLGNTTVVVNNREYTTDSEGNVTITGLYPGLITVSYARSEDGKLIPMGELNATDGNESQTFEISPTGSSKVSDKSLLIVLGSVALGILLASGIGVIIARYFARPRFAAASSHVAPVFVDGVNSSASNSNQPPQYYHPQTVIEPAQPGVQQPAPEQPINKDDPVHRP